MEKHLLESTPPSCVPSEPPDPPDLDGITSNDSRKWYLGFLYVMHQDVDVAMTIRVKVGYFKRWTYKVIIYLILYHVTCR